MSEDIRTCEQRSDEWFKARIGKFTASNFGDVMTSGRKKDEVFSKKAMEIIYDKIAEKATGRSRQIFGDALEHGVENEPYAIALYEQSTGRKVSSVGFVPLKGYEEYSGGSPDGIIDEGKGIIEVKCPYNSAYHIWSVVNKGIRPKTHSKYYTQMQLNMLCTGAEYCDFISFDPRVKDSLKIVVVRYEKDYEFIAKIYERLDLVIEEMKRIEESLR